ncbi:chromosome partitioning protein [Treponema primitia]|uniref:PspA/IM30 family protein n=1 Tax=Treponema primitia TaxID=88058 RepID=UPI00397E9394
MEKPSEDLSGMGAADAKEYIFHYITTLKLTEKKHAELKGEHEKWLSRLSLAQSRGAEDLILAAQTEADKAQEELSAIEAEITDLRSQIGRMREQLPGLAARERSIDPDLLEQELLIALGGTPGEEIKPDTERQFQIAEADAALEALKAKMNGEGQP